MRSTASLLFLVAVAPLAAQTPTATASAARVARAVDAKVVRAHLEFLADDALEGRATGTRGGALAAKYIAAQFERLGLEPAGDSGTYFQRVPVISLTPEPTLSIGGAPFQHVVSQELQVGPHHLGVDGASNAGGGY